MPSAAALLARIYARPDEDDARRAYADALPRLDPRRELVTLQLAPSRTPQEERRVRALIRAHQKTWLAPLRGALVATTVRWERGFPVAGRLALQKTDAARERLVACAALATLRELDLEQGDWVPPYAFLQRFVFQPSLRGLRELRGLPPEWLARLLKSRPPRELESVDCSLGSGLDRAGMASIARAFDAGGLPALRTLGLTLVAAREVTDYAWVWETAGGRRLRRLRVNVGSYTLPAWHRALTAHAPPAELEALELYTSHRYELRRTDRGWTRLTGAIHAGHFPDVERGSLGKALEEIGEGLEEIEVEGR